SVIQKLNLATGAVTRLAGGGQGDDGSLATQALLRGFMYGLTMDSRGNLFFAQTENHRVRRIDAQTQIITTVAGTGVKGFSGDGGLATQATLNSPDAVALDSQGNIFIADRENYCIRRIDAVTGRISTLTLNIVYPDVYPIALAMDAGNNLFMLSQEGIWRIP